MDQLPTSFGKQTRGPDVEAQINRTKRATTPSSQASGSGGSDGSSDDDSDDEYPVSHSLTLETQTRPVVSISLDSSGSRLVTASADTIKLHDFSSMTPTTLRAFKSVESAATHHVEFGSSSSFLTIASTAKILSRDGELLTEFVKGDMYIRDMHNTKGHVSEITTGTWHPTDKQVCVTAGTDSTLRIWDINNKRSQRDIIVQKSKAPGGRTRMTAVAWGEFLVGAASDGTLCFWGSSGPFTRPSAEVKEAHAKDTWTGGVDISADGRLIVSRGGDDTVKLWDTRKFKTPIVSVAHESTSSQFPTTNIKFSPGSSSIITGSVTGHLHILGLSLRPELVAPITRGSPVITVQWHDKLNQILTGSANSETTVLYNPTISERGAKLVVTKAPKRRHIDDDPNLTTDQSQGLSGEGIVNPNGLLSNSGPSATSHAARHPTIGLTASGKSRDPRRPNYPAQTPFAKSQPDEKHIRDHIPLSSMRDEDPREALLKYAEVAKKDPLFTNAWKDTQPKTIYADLSEEEDEGEEPNKKKARR